MKSTIKNLFLSAAVVLLACSFAEGPATCTTGNADLPALKATPVGGAYLVFANKMGGEITQKEIAGQNKLGVDGCARGSRIFQYTLNVTKRGRTSSYRAKSNILSKEMLTQLNSLSAGDEFEFKKIQAYLPNGKDVVDVHARKFTIVGGKV
jgi:hypothetical protein